LAADIRVCGAAGALQGRLTGNARVRSLTDEGTALALFLGGTPLDAGTLLAAGLVRTLSIRESRGRRRAQIGGNHRIAGPIATRLGKEAIWRGLGQPWNRRCATRPI
jgi:enoyl-CoA hydratase/carnithine racemase